MEAQHLLLSHTSRFHWSPDKPVRAEGNIPGGVPGSPSSAQTCSTALAFHYSSVAQEAVGSIAVANVPGNIINDLVFLGHELPY